MLVFETIKDGHTSNRELLKFCKLLDCNDNEIESNELSNNIKDYRFFNKYFNINIYYHFGADYYFFEDNFTNRFKIIGKIKKQWDEMIKRGIIPLFEIEINLKNEKEYLLVNLSFNDKGIIFEFDDFSLPVSFDGEIIETSEGFILPLDPCFESLNHYLEMIMENINEGFILPNNLLLTGEEI